MSSVADMLALSMRAHRTAHAIRNGKGTGDNRALLAEARRQRLAAHSADPTHADTAWADEQFPPTGYPGMHERMLAFYGKALD